MGSHYIPVSGITIDTIKDAIADALPDIIDLDILCPAAGYDTTPPSPAVFCPANGYFPDDSWVPPVETVTPDGSGGDQILLLCDDTGPGGLGVTLAVSTGNRKLELLRTDMTVIDTVEQASNNFVYTFPTRGTGANYIIRLSPSTPGAKIQIFTRYTTTPFPYQSYRILQAKFYTPDLTSLSSAFRDIAAFKECIFLTNMNALTNMSYAFYGSGVENITWPSQMNAMTNFNYTFGYTYFIRHIDISGTSFALLSNMSFMIAYSNVQSFKFPASLPEASTLQSFASNAVLLKSCILPTSMPKVTRIDSMFYNAYVLNGDLTFPEMPLCTMINSAFQKTSIRKLAFTGAMPLCTTGASLIRDCSLVEELVMPTQLAPTFTHASWMQNSAPLKFTPPMTITYSVTMWGDTGYILQRFETATDWGTNQHNIMVASSALEEFYQPTLRAGRLALGLNYSGKVYPAPFTSVEIDWANSLFDNINTPHLVFMAQLPAAEINRIFAALPAMAKTIDVQNNPGFAGCDPTIAQAKGWTVTGA